MPVYEYRCRECDEVFEVRRPMSESAASATCPAGHPGAVRLLSVFASVGAGSESASAGPPPGGCGAGCACVPD